MPVSAESDEPGDLRRVARGAWGLERMAVCDSHREDQLLNPCTITGESLPSDVRALKICILVI